MSGPWMTSTSANSVLTCATDMAGVTMDTAGQHFTQGHSQIKLADVVLYYFFISFYIYYFISLNLKAHTINIFYVCLWDPY